MGILVFIPYFSGAYGIFVYCCPCSFFFLYKVPPVIVILGKSLSGEPYSVKVFPVKVEDDRVYVELPPQSQLDALLATDLHCIGACEARHADTAVT